MKTLLRVLFALYACFISCLIIVAFTGCTPRDAAQNKPVGVVPDTVRIHDTIPVRYESETDSIVKLNGEIIRLQTLARLQGVAPITTREHDAVATVEQIKYYIKRCDARPDNREFLFGWLKRALKQ